MEPITFPPGHPAAVQDGHPSVAEEEKVLAQHALPNPGSPLAESNASPEAMPSMDHGNIHGMDTIKSMPGGEAMYTCPMHPEVIEHDEGRCPICKMRLVPAVEQDAMPEEKP